MRDLELPLPNISCFPNFQQATQAVLNFLHQRLGFQLWAFTRVDGDDQLILVACDQGYGVNPGDVVCWSDSICSRMVKRLGPRITPNIEEVPAYAKAPIRKSVFSCAYIGIPLYQKDGSLFGTLCAIDPKPQPHRIRQELSLIELQAQLLSTLLHYELLEQKQMRRREREKAADQQDDLTGFYNQQGWEQLIEAEQERCRRYGSTVGVILIELDWPAVTDDAGDPLLRAATCFQQTIRSDDIIARLERNRLGILIIEPPLNMMQPFVTRIQQTLATANLPAAVGWAVHDPKLTLRSTIELADQRMRQQKIWQKYQ